MISFHLRAPADILKREGKPWSFDGDGEAFKLASEAKRIDLAYLLDPYVAVSTSGKRCLADGASRHPAMERLRPFIGEWGMALGAIRKRGNRRAVSSGATGARLGVQQEAYSP